MGTGFIGEPCAKKIEINQFNICIQNTVITQFQFKLALRNMYITLKNTLTESSNVNFYA